MDDSWSLTFTNEKCWSCRICIAIGPGCSVRGHSEESAATPAHQFPGTGEVRGVWGQWTWEKGLQEDMKHWPGFNGDFMRYEIYNGTGMYVLYIFISLYNKQMISSGCLKIGDFWAPGVKIHRETYEVFNREATLQSKWMEVVSTCPMISVISRKDIG